MIKRFLTSDPRSKNVRDEKLRQSDVAGLLKNSNNEANRAVAGFESLFINLRNPKSSYMQDNKTGSGYKQNCTIKSRSTMISKIAFKS